MENITFDQAVEILEISDLSKIRIEDLPSIEKRAKKRWHPDKISHLKDEGQINKYTQNFQKVKNACEVIYSYLKGTFHAGEKVTDRETTAHQQPEEIIRRNAADIQSTLKSLWNLIKEKKYKLSVEEVVLSDGFKLHDLLQQDFKEDIAVLSIISFFYGSFFMGILTAIGTAISPIIGTLIGIVWLLQMLSCILGFLPLSRFWLPEQLQDIMIKLINFGLKIYYFAFEQSQHGNNFVALLVVLPELFAKSVKYIVLLPLYKLAEIFVGDKVLGMVKTKVSYFAGIADWYAEELLNNSPNNFSGEQLFDLSRMYSELSDVKDH